MFLTYQQASRPYKRLVVDHFTFCIFSYFSHNIKLWVSFSPWRKRFVVIAGFPLSGPSRVNAMMLLFVVVFFGSFAKQIAFLFKGKFPLPKAIFSTQRYFGLVVVVVFWLLSYVVPKTKYTTLGPKF